MCACAIWILVFNYNKNVLFWKVTCGTRSLCQSFGNFTKVFKHKSLTSTRSFGQFGTDNATSICHGVMSRLDLQKRCMYILMDILTRGALVRFLYSFCLLIILIIVMVFDMLVIF